MGSLKRSAEGERNRGNTVRKGESFILYIFIEMPACPERGVMLHLRVVTHSVEIWGVWNCAIFRGGGRDRKNKS